jgi:ATP adenylyltransferase/5',5'''-P-1,P-4-tetraphosphate phosphorylase II
LVASILKKKPGSPSAVNTEIWKAPTIPGSDISVEGFEIGALAKHLLTFNMFSMYRPHFLLLTQDGRRRQTEPLDLDDFTAMHMLITTSDMKLLAFYNCGAPAGCSRMHKHMQAIPQTSFDPWQNHLGDCKGSSPFTLFRYAFQEGFPSPETLLDIYMQLLKKAETALGQPTDYDAQAFGRAPPHNVLIDEKYIAVIPRRSVGRGRLTLNAAGMMGMIWVGDDNHLAGWLESPSTAYHVLSEAGVPNTNAIQNT